MTDEQGLQSRAAKARRKRAAKARRKRARQFAGMLLLAGIVSVMVLYVGINTIALAVAP